MRRSAARPVLRPALALGALVLLVALGGCRDRGSRRSAPLDWENTLLIVTADHANGYLRFAPGRVLDRGDLPAQQAGSPPWYPDDEITYGAPGAHTNEPVTLYAGGRAAALFAEYEGRNHPGTLLLDNTAVFEVMRRAIGLTPLSPMHGRRR